MGGGQSSGGEIGPGNAVACRRVVAWTPLPDSGMSGLFEHDPGPSFEAGSALEAVEGHGWGGLEGEAPRARLDRRVTTASWYRKNAASGLVSSDLQVIRTRARRHAGARAG